MKIGLRTIKTSISVLVCLGIYLGLKCLEFIPGTPENLAFILYNPFFASIATAYSIYPNKKKSVEQAKNRCVASFIGGFVGIFVTLGFELISGHKWPSALSSSILDLMITYVLVAIFTISVIVIGVKLDQRPAIFVSILTFLSVTVNPNALIAEQYGVWVFGINRISSTIIGVLVALGVNLFRLPHFTHNKDLLFTIGIDGILKDDSESFEGYRNYKLNSMIFKKMNCTLYTTRMPATFMYILDDVRLNNPIVCCSGAALFDPVKLKYLKTEKISYEDSVYIDHYLETLDVTPFKYYVIQDVINVFVEKIDNEGERLYANKYKNAPYCNFTFGPNTSKDDVLFYLLVEEAHKTDEIINEIKTGPLKDKVIVQKHDCFENDISVKELKYIKIYSKKIEKLNVLKEYVKENDMRIVGLTTTSISNILLQNSDLAITYSSNEEAKDYADIILNSNSYDELFRISAQIYYSKKYKKDWNDSNE